MIHNVPCNTLRLTPLQLTPSFYYQMAHTKMGMMGNAQYSRTLTPRSKIYGWTGKGITFAEEQESHWGTPH